MIDTKRARITRALKQLVLNSPGAVSRGDVAEALDIDLRTAAIYLEQLRESGLLRCEKLVSGGKGRPSRVYCSNAANLAFLGIKIFSNLEVDAVLIDSVGRELARKNMLLPANASRLTAFTAILDLIKGFRVYGNKKLFGVGMAISRWLQPPLAGEDVYANLADYLARESSLAIHRDVNINAVAFAEAQSMKCRNLAEVHAGKVIEFGLVRDGLVQPDFAGREAWLSHLCVNPDGRRCYCGKYGCLENYITSGARSERLKNDNNPAVRRALGEMLGSAMVRLVRKYPVEAVLLVGVEDIFPAAEEYFSSRVTGVSLQCKRAPQSVEYAVALEAAYLELHRYTEKSSEHKNS